ncbi:MAG: VOC family protein [Flavobacteriales bacterium]|nr:VOC family protein [Flavobacteriales bacterium]
MKNTRLYLLFTFALLSSCHSSHPPIQRTFVAVIVEDMEISSEWYRTHFSLTEYDQRSVPERGLIQSNLINEHLHVELIQLDSAIDLEDSLANYGSNSKVEGLFKIGFVFADLAGFAKKHGHLEQLVHDPVSEAQTLVIKDPDGNRIQLFEK